MYFHLRSLQGLSKINIIIHYLSFRNISGAINIKLSQNVMLVFGPVLSDTSNDHSASIFRVKKSNKRILLGLFRLESSATPES
jgi:hypothetical protein